MIPRLRNIPKLGAQEMDEPILLDKEAIRAATLILDYVRAMKEVLIKDAQGAQE